VWAFISFWPKPVKPLSAAELYVRHRETHDLLSTTNFTQAKLPAIGKFSTFEFVAYQHRRASRLPRQMSRALNNTASRRSGMPTPRAFARHFGWPHANAGKSGQQNFHHLRASGRLPAANSPQHQTSPAGPLPNLALQPTANGLPPLGLHFMVAQIRQPVVCG